MCDCYYHECGIEGCPNSIPMHIADYNYERERFTIWCRDHVYLAPPGAVHFEYDHDEDDWGDPNVHEVRRCAIIGPEVGEGNYPNANFRILGGARDEKT